MCPRIVDIGSIISINFVGLIQIAQMATVAHGTVGLVLAELPKLGFIAEVGGKRRLLQPERLLQQWVEALCTHSPNEIVARSLSRGSVGLA